MRVSTWAPRAFAGFLVCGAWIGGAHGSDRDADGTFHVGSRSGNGVIQAEINGRALNGVHSPMITELRIGESVIVVPRENVGAGLQFSSRSDGGNKYNPTLGGDCFGRAPQVGAQFIQNWQPLDFVPAANGVLVGVQPLLYQGDQTATAQVDPGCTGAVLDRVAAAPYHFHWGAILGDGTRVPREVMLLAMGIQKLGADAPHLGKALTEAPAMFLQSAFAYAYTAAGTPDTFQYVALRDSLTGSHDVRRWRLNFLREVPSTSLVMLCTEPIAAHPLCVALYSGFGVKALIGLRSGSVGYPDLVYMGLTGAPACVPGVDAACPFVKDALQWIVDEQPHTLSRILAVGSPDTIRAAIAQTLQSVPITSNRLW